MLSSRCFNFFIILMKFCGLQTFQYSGNKYKESKLGISLYLLNFLYFSYFCVNFFLNLSKQHFNFDSLRKKISMLIILSIIITRISVLVVNFLTRKKMFKLFKNLENFDETLRQNFIPLISNKNLYWSVIGLTAKFLGFCYIFGSLRVVYVALYMTIYLPVDFYFLIVLMINNQIEVVLKLLRYTIYILDAFF